MGLARQIVEEVFEIVKNLAQGKTAVYPLAKLKTNMAQSCSSHVHILERCRIVIDRVAGAADGSPRKSFKGIKSRKRRKWGL